MKSGFNAVDLPALSVENEVRALKRLREVLIKQLDDYDKTYEDDLETLTTQISQNENSYSEVLTKVNDSINNFLSKAN